jgi:hypothetical protein
LRILLNFSYDGNGIGTFNGDTMRNILGSFAIRQINAGTGLMAIGSNGVFELDDNSGGYDNTLKVASSGVLGNYDRLHFDASRVVPTGNEFASASISILYCVSY